MLNVDERKDDGVPEFRMPPLEGYAGEPEEVERRWFREAYLPRGSVMRQLSFRCLFLGCVIGGIMAIPNIYMGMKGVAIMGLSLTCTLMAFMLWNGLGDLAGGFTRWGT